VPPDEAGGDLPHHHYIPVFYLKQWATPEKSRLFEFSRQYRGVVKPRPTSPTGTGYVPGLYRLHGLPEDLAEQVERDFMSFVDNLSNDALQILLGKSNRPMVGKVRSAWSRFITGILFRNPEHISRGRKEIEDEWLRDHETRRAEYEAWKTPEHPEFLEYIIQSTDRATMRLAQMIIDNKQMGTQLNAMRWFVVDTSDVGRPFFTSDRPTIFSNGLQGPDGHIALPISPHRLFVACNQQRQENLIRAIPRRELVKFVNRHIVRRAVKYAWNTDKDELAFVDKHLSREAHLDTFFDYRPPQPPTPLSIPRS
jgi:hypothetical protein